MVVKHKHTDKGEQTTAAFRGESSTNAELKTCDAIQCKARAYRPERASTQWYTLVYTLGDSGLWFTRHHE